jgi:hypothetical protein
MQEPASLPAPLLVDVSAKIDTATVTVQTSVDKSTAVLQAIPQVTLVLPTLPGAQEAVDSATVAVQVAQTQIVLAQQTLETATASAAVVPVAQAGVDSATAVVAIAVKDVGTAQGIVDSSTAIVATKETALSAVTDSAAQANAAADSSQVTTTVSAPGVIATVYAAARGAAPALPAVDATPVKTLVIPYISLDNFDASPAGGILGSGRANNTIVQFTGQVTVPSDATAIKYAVYSDDGAILYVNGVKVISNWRDQGSTWSTYSVTMPVTAGQSQDITLYYYNNAGGYRAVLGWGITKADGTGYFTSPTGINYTHGTTTITHDPILVAAAQTADAAIAPATQDVVIANQNLTIATQNLTQEQQNLTTANQNLTIKKSVLDVVQATAMRDAVAADTAANTAVTAAQTAATALTTAVSVVQDQLAIKAAAEAKAVADAAAQAEAARLAALAASTASVQTPTTSNLAPETPKAPPAVPEPSPVQTPVPVQEAPAPQEPTPAPVADATPNPEPAPAPAAPAPDAPPVPTNPLPDTSSNQPSPAPKPLPQPKPPTQTSSSPTPAAPLPVPAPTPQAPVPPTPTSPPPVVAPTPPAPGLVQNNPNSLPKDIPLPPPPTALVAHVQEDKAGVENGGIKFFGTQAAPQVVGEDGKLTPPAPPAGSGLPIPPDAITLTSTFIGQPGGTTFNAPDIAVPVVETPLPQALAAVPGAEAVNKAFVAMANIGNDMSPVTRKKAKKILIITFVAGQIARFRRRD